MKKIVLITCYFGNFPWYFSLFLKSCSYNPTVDFIIFSDCKIDDYQIPENVKIVPFTIEKFNQLATEKLGFNVNIQYAYKFCDFKPAYGVIFSQYTKGCDFWGMTDIDIVFGRIREFMTDELLNTYQVISVRNDYPTGSFMLFKNFESTNNLFKKSKDYKKVFQSDTHYCFDECNFKHNFLQAGGNIEDVNCEIESMHHVMKKEEAKNNLKVHFDFLVIEGLPGQLKWDKGILSFKNQFEVLLHHLILFKDNKYTIKKTWKHIPDIFYIDKYMIRKYGLDTLKGFLADKIYNMIRPSIKRLIFKLDYRISKQLKRKVKAFEAARYKLNDVHISLFEDSRKENTVTLHSDPTKRVLVKSFFHENSFFVKSIPHARYSLTQYSEVLTEIRINGNTQVFKKDRV